MMKKKKFIKLISMSFIILLIIMFYSIYSNSKENISLKHGVAYGDPQAKIQMIEYINFQCKDCYVLYNNISETLKNKIENGEIYYIIKHVDLDGFEYSKMIFNSINDIHDFETFDYIMKNYELWSYMDSADEVKEFFNLDENDYQDRIEMQKYILKEISELNINFIPTFYLNGERFTGIFSSQEFDQIIDNIQKLS